jgi:hypothetical protein
MKKITNRKYDITYGIVEYLFDKYGNVKDIGLTIKDEHGYRETWKGTK